MWLDPTLDVGDALRRLAGAAETGIHGSADARARAAAAAVTSKRQVDPLPRLKKTLGEHYRKKREHYGLDHPHFYESDLRNLFSDAPQYAKNLSAARFVRRIRKEVRSTVASFTDSYQYTIDQVLEIRSSSAVVS